MSKAKRNHKYIFVIGGVMSGVGKGIASSSIGTILQAKGFKVNLMKIDPYLNVDAGTMNPTEHGEVFVLNSGLETDQDMGNYERFLGRDLSPADYMTSGMVYKTVIERERSLGYKGKFVEAIPHVTDEIRHRFIEASKISESDISVVEIGGTIGDFQNVLFIEAARVLKLKNPDDVIFILVSYLPVPGTIGEMKTRPTQNAIRQVNSYGVQPDIIIARGSQPLDHKRKEKIAMSCSVPVEHVISAPDVETIYEVPINFEKDDLSGILLRALHVRPVKKDGLAPWKKLVRRIKSLKDEVRIGIIGKYFDTGDFVLSDAYISVIEAIKHSAYELGKKPVLTWISSKDFESNAKNVSMLKAFDGVLVPGGFGETGIEGKIKAIQFARENKIPYFGLCYGMQLMTIEYARNVVGLKGANTTEIDPKTEHPVIDIMPEQKKHMQAGNFGATMRLGAYSCVLKPDTIARKAYLLGDSLTNRPVSQTISERHRHRYEVNPEYIAQIEKAGLVFSGKSPDGVLMEIAELPRTEHPFFLGTQFHPELKSRPLAPHPLFTAFLKAGIDCSKKK
ncbi:MAG: CTP synthetase [Candidatus Taylorbacteria bacterium CG11_big_fil_rev_8_21_14_0_20_46_11]|uniref:CTP synthase n=1 Tax=Candidatus Taylorbacteria bacterium CG11_big_fil_rev_8_21_14_0_20_46_11 TaxID=1975025 RepID=A0A2H0KET4_9BACT|nr:MAG: CTP synthetase [Candidatus Taylorbacteria bacterium CG11_big_fil_rev_8_21_14_0_20_46_11]